VTREQRGSVEVVRSSNECMGDFESTEEAFCCPVFRVTTWALCIDPPFAKLIRGSWFAKVVVMSERSTEQIRELLDSLYRVDSGRILATLIRLLGDFDLAEEAMHEAFAAALSLWPRSGVPGNPRPWLISTARFKAIDTLRRRARFDASQDELARYLEAQWSSAERSNEEYSLEDDGPEDDRLRLIDIRSVTTDFEQSRRIPIFRPQYESGRSVTQPAGDAAVLWDNAAFHSAFQ